MACVPVVLRYQASGYIVAKTRAQPELWYWHHSYNVNYDNTDKSRALIDKAVAAGYTGVVFWDSGFNYLGNESWPAEHEDFLRDAVHYANKKHLKVIAAPTLYGFSNEALEANPNWAESQRVVGTQFEVDKLGRRLVLKNSFPGLANGGFESGKRDWFSTDDPGIGVNTVAHSGKASGVIVDAPVNARFRQKIPLQPWRQYHLRLFYRTSKFRGNSMVSVYDAGDLEKVRFNITLPAAGDHDWTQTDYTFNSQDSTEGYLYFGVWGGSSGVLWFDDISVEETALVYLTRRSGAPLEVYDPANPGKLYREGTDFKRIEDERMVSTNQPFTDDYHEPSPVLLTKKTQLRPGQTVAIDFYSAVPVPGTHGVSMCMTEPAALKWVRQNGRAINRVLPPDGGIVLGYDEIRQMNSCASCRAKNMSGGQLLAWSVGETIKTYSSVAPGRPLYTWSDMFDPKHNAHTNYFSVEGDLAGGWAGLPPTVTIFNWNLDQLHDSLLWFAGRNSAQPVPHDQIVAGYYDRGNGTAAAQEELGAASGVPGVQGFMYTTWNDDYSQLAPFAQTIRDGWEQYRSSVRSD
ncbi:MAG: hypothetical protein ACJ746_31005 [Bryobacteraceae bacterium]